MNLNEHDFKVPKGLSIARLTVLTLEQTKHLAPIDVNLYNFLERQHPGEMENFINQLTQGPPDEYSHQKFWFPTPEDKPDLTKLNGMERRIYDEILEFKEAEGLNPQNSAEEKQKFLDNFVWDGSILNDSEKKRVEQLLVKYPDTFARHRLDVGINHEFKVKLTPEHDKPIYAQSLPTPINLKDDLTVELALMQYYRLITTLPYSKYSSPIFAQKKPNGKLRILIDLRRINHLLRHDYDRNNHPISTLADTAAHMAGKTFLVKIDSSQALSNVSRWRIGNQHNYLPSTSHPVLSRIKG